MLNCREMVQQGRAGGEEAVNALSLLTPQRYHSETKWKDLEFAMNRHNLCFVDKMPRCEILKCVHYII